VALAARAGSGAARRSARAAMASVMPARKPGVRALAAQATRDSILRAATKVFAKHGFAGGRVEQISKAAKSYDRMIYYYFGSKEGLFIAVLEEMYRRFNEAESKLVLGAVPPVEALQTVIRFMWGYYQKNPEFITLLNTENLHRGRHIAKSLRASEYSSQAVSVLHEVLVRGAQQKLFRTDVAARDVYLMIAAMAYFYLSNRFTLSAFLGEALEAPAALAHWETFLVDAVLRTVAPAPTAAKRAA
jgi:TetR/AcrR family transcriptional regulator, upper aerobic nicotinate degradation pathway regulator